MFQGSVTDAGHARRVVDDSVAAWGGVDVLVNNAAVFRGHPTVLTDEEDWDEVMSVNVKGAYVFSRACLRPMLRAGAGHILNIGAFAVDWVSALPVVFAASKGAIEAMTRAMAREVGRYGVRVNCLVPGLCEAGMGERLAGPAPRRVSAAGGAGPPGDARRDRHLRDLARLSPRTPSCRARSSTVDGGL